MLAQYLIEQAWENTLKTQQPTPPWSWADTYPVAKISVPQLGIQQYILAGANGSPLAFAPGLYAGTKDLTTISGQEKLPDTVIAGHHNTHFDFLKQLKYGEVIYFQNMAGENGRYQVNNIQTFDIQQQQLPAYFTGKTIQLVTCQPSYLGEIHPNQRLVVTLVREEQLQ
ncbi:MAG: class GN sortase [Gammaproteobacteria bacterium]|nr:MAG: class GN sortase [Gammaproteobacteria bacterium]